MKKVQQKLIAFYKSKDWKFLISAIMLFIIMFFSQTFYGLDKINDVEKTTTQSLFRLKMQGLPNYLDECVFYYQEGSTNGFDSNYDAYKLFGPNPAPRISIDNDSLLMSINGIPPVSQTYSTNILTTTHISGSFTITAADVQGLPSGTCLFLKDLHTNTITNLLISPYVFTLLNTTTSSRFTLTITYNTLPITSNLIQPSCQITNGGKAVVMGNTAAPWNYIWRDTLGTVIKTNLGLNTYDSLDNLSNGKYNVEITSTSNACLRNEISFNINKTVSPLICFTSPDSIIFSSSNSFLPNNLSSNCSSYFWDFGDGFGNSTDFEPSYNYSTPGTYLTKLVGISSTGCKDSVLKPLQVVDFSTNIISKLNGKVLLADLGDNKFMLKLSQYSLNIISTNVISLDGREFFKKDYSVNDNNVLIDLNYLKVGLYLMQFKSNENELLTSKVYIK